MQKRYGKDWVCRVLVSRRPGMRDLQGVSRSRQHAWQEEKGQRSPTQQPACTRSCPKEAALLPSEQALQPNPDEGRGSKQRQPQSHRAMKATRSLCAEPHSEHKLFGGSSNTASAEMAVMS